MQLLQLLGDLLRNLLLVKLHHLLLLLLLLLLKLLLLLLLLLLLNLLMYHWVVLLHLMLMCSTHVNRFENSVFVPFVDVQGLLACADLSAVVALELDSVNDQMSGKGKISDKVDS